MNRSKIEWTDYTWNPVTGCTHGCSFCYARKMAQRLKGRAGYPLDKPFTPTFHRDRLDQPSKIRKPSKIFVCSMGDLFDPTVPIQWVTEVFRVMFENPRHTFQILTKNPIKLIELSISKIVFPANLWIGVSVCKREDLGRLTYLTMLDEPNLKFVSFEPLLEDLFPNTSLEPIQYFYDLDWVIIGGLTGPKAREPDFLWIKHILELSDKQEIPVFIKNNAGWPQHIHNYPKKEGSE